MPGEALATVHQFHAGSGLGDAITNAMLLIRGLLRAQGFRSEIFVETRGAGLEREVRLLEQMPGHGDYVLLLHHSMGFPSFDALLALPARKVLIYHNITPPELLTDVPRIARLARLGRSQLATLRDHVAVALADSDYNAVELHRLGFAAIRTCTLLFDPAAIIARATGMRPGDGVFTVLFVGRVTPSKAQDDLVAAFAAFRARFAKPCRLVLVGALDPDEHRYLDLLQRHVDQFGLDADVQLTGLVSDAELTGWYRQADLYVSLSHHEGFGVPLVEAMAHGIPVVAWPAGAVPYTLDGAGTLLTSRDPAAVADVMLKAHPAAPAVLARFAPDRQLPVLLEALAAAGALPPVDAAAHAEVAASLRVAVTGSVDAGTATVARAIEAQRPGAVRVVPAAGAPVFDASVPDSEQGFVAALATRPPPGNLPELVLSRNTRNTRNSRHCEPASAWQPRAARRAWVARLWVASSQALLAMTPSCGTHGNLAAALVTADDLPPPDALNAFAAVFASSRVVARSLVDAGVSVPVLTVDWTAPDWPAVAALLLAGPAPAIRLAWVTSWGVRCGVAEYSRSLLDALPRDGVAELAILADDRTEAGGAVTSAWQAGGSDPRRLLAAIGRADPDVLVIQHQPGLLPWSGLALLLDAIALDDRVVIVTLHNTRHLLEIAADERTATVAALRRVARVLVHTAADVATLTGFDVTDCVTLLPHPAPPMVARAAAPFTTDAPVIGCTGFFLLGKGIGALIAAAAQLRDRWPGLRLRLVNAEYDDPLSATEIAACRQLAQAHRLAVEWHTEFIPLPRQAELLAGCDLLVLPYQRSLEASSAALRNALASGVPVAVTPLPLFDEAAGAVFRLPGCAPADIAAGLAELWADAARRHQLRDAAQAWLAARATPDIARRLHGMLLGLAAQHRLGVPLHDAAP